MEDDNKNSKGNTFAAYMEKTYVHIGGGEFEERYVPTSPARQASAYREQRKALRGLAITKQRTEQQVAENLALQQVEKNLALARKQKQEEALLAKQAHPAAEVKTLWRKLKECFRLESSRPSAEKSAPNAVASRASPEQPKIGK